MRCGLEGWGEGLCPRMPKHNMRGDASTDRHCERSAAIQSRKESVDCFVASLLAMTGRHIAPHALFNILNTPLVMAIQRLSTVTSVVMKIRLRVERTTCGFETRISPILPGSTKCVSSCTVASIGFPDTYRAVMPQVRSANVISTPPCTRPRRLWCLSCATRAYSCSPLTTFCHSGPTRLMNPLVSTMVQPEALSFCVALSVICLVLRARGGSFHQSRRCCSQAGWSGHLTMPQGGTSQRVARRLQ